VLTHNLGAVAEDILLPSSALSDELDGLSAEGTPPSTPIAFGSKRFFEELGVPATLREIITRAMRQPPARHELHNLGIYSSEELTAAGL
jgi:hypothetical protein